MPDKTTRQTEVNLTQQCRRSCILSFDTSRSREALWSVAAAVIQPQLFTWCLRGRQFLRYLLLSTPFLTPQFVTVLPQWKTEEIKGYTWWENNKKVLILVINTLTQCEAKRTLVGASCLGLRPWGIRCLMLAQPCSVCWGPSSTCGQTGPGQTEGCWTTAQNVSTKPCEGLKPWIFSSTKYPWTYKANSSRNRLLYCFFGFIVLKKGSFITSGQTAGQGLPHIRLEERNPEIHLFRQNNDKKKKYLIT